MIKPLKIFFSLVAIALLLLSIPMQLAVNAKAETWPWGSAEEPYPWLQYLANLTKERGIVLRVLTRHEPSIQSLARTLFLQSPVAKALGIKDIQFIYVSASLWPSQIEEAKKRGISIDVAWGGGPTVFNMLDEGGYLMPIDASTHPEHYAILYELSKIPKTIAGSPVYKVDDRGRIRWIGASVSSFGFTYNRMVIQQYGLPEPKKWEDLASPLYAKYLPARQLVGIADPTQSTSNTRIYEIILQAKGWEEGWKILTLMAANSMIYQGSGDVRDAVIRGDIAVGITIDFYGYMAMNVNPDCKYVAPEGETIVNVDPIAIINSTKYPVHAAAFVAWVLSEFGGQQIWLDKEINRLPINPRTFDTQAGAQRQDLKQSFEELMRGSFINFNETLSALWVNSIVYYFKATLVNAHDDLQAAWAQIANAYLQGKISKEWFNYLVNELAKPVSFKDPLTGTTTTFTIDYAIKVSNSIATNSSLYQALMSAWESAAREKYRYVLSLLDKALRGEPIPTTTTSPSPTQITTTARSITSASTAMQSTIQTTSSATTSTSLSSTTLRTEAPSTTSATTGAGGATLATTVAVVVVVIIVVVAIIVFVARRR